MVGKLHSELVEILRYDKFGEVYDLLPNKNYELITNYMVNARDILEYEVSGKLVVYTDLPNLVKIVVEVEFAEPATKKEIKPRDMEKEDKPPFYKTLAAYIQESFLIELTSK